MVFPKENTIRLRNIEQAKENESLLWRALCDAGKAAERYLAPDAVFMFPGGTTSSEGTGSKEPRIVTMESEPSLPDFLGDEYVPWTTYRMSNDVEFVEIDMMATSVVYRVELGRLGPDDKLERVQAVASSVWRQDAAGDWKICMHHLSFL